MENAREKLKILKALLERNERVYEDVKNALSNAELYLSVFKENIKEIEDHSNASDFVWDVKENNGEELKWKNL